MVPVSGEIVIRWAGPDTHHYNITANLFQGQPIAYRYMRIVCGNRIAEYHNGVRKVNSIAMLWRQSAINEELHGRISVGSLGVKTA